MSQNEEVHESPKVLADSSGDFLALECDGRRRLWPDEAEPKGQNQGRGSARALLTRAPGLPKVIIRGAA